MKTVTSLLLPLFFAASPSWAQDSNHAHVRKLGAYGSPNPGSGAGGSSKASKSNSGGEYCPSELLTRVRIRKGIMGTLYALIGLPYGAIITQAARTAAIAMTPELETVFADIIEFAGISVDADLTYAQTDSYFLYTGDNYYQDTAEYIKAYGVHVYPATSFALT